MLGCIYSAKTPSNNKNLYPRFSVLISEPFLAEIKKLTQQMSGRSLSNMKGIRYPLLVTGEKTSHHSETRSALALRVFFYLDY